jgi:hypothetical protein
MKMKRLLNLCLALTLISSCANNQTKNTETTVVTIEYSNEINGYSVKVIWKPKEVRYSHTKGPAIIEFYNKKDSTSFTLTNNNFGILNSKLPFSYSTDSTEIISLNQNDIKLVYVENNLKSEEDFGTTNEPFFFQDLDFDNIKELVIVEIGNGQRGVASFKAYKLEYGDIQSELYGITNVEPFKSLDEMSKIDYVNRRIIIYGSGGVCASGSEIYKLQPSNYEENKFVLETVIVEERDDNLNKCYELKYKIINQSKQLISKKEIK